MQYSSILKKLYITLQFILAGGGVLVFLVSLGTAIHDAGNSYLAEGCAREVLRIESSTEDWFNDLSSRNGMLKNASYELLKRKCGSYFKIGRDYSYLKLDNFRGWGPLVWSERLQELGLILGMTLFLSLFLWGLKRWLAWLIKADLPEL